MTATILIGTPHEAFGELLRQSLAEHGRYQVEVFPKATALQDRCAQNGAELAILDTDLKDVPFLAWVRGLQAAHPGMRLIVIPPYNDPQDPMLGGWKPDGYLSRPFYLPELLEKIEGLVDGRRAAGQPADYQADPPGEGRISGGSGADASPWLEEPQRAAQDLSRFLQDAAAQAALIARKGELWAYAGQVPQDAARELAAAIARYWDSQRSCDLVRYVHLENPGGDYMLYATHLTGELVLALAYEAATPFSRVRAQTIRFAQALSSPSPRSSGSPPAQEPAQEMEGEGGAPDIAPFLADLPDPDPQAELPRAYNPAAQAWVKEISGEPVEAQPAGAGNLLQVETPEFDQELLAVLAGHAPVREAPAEDAPPLEEEASVAQPETESETGERGLARPSPRHLLVPARPEAPTHLMVDLTYAGVLIPRFPQHYLAGDLAARLGRWLPDLCIAFGWRLEGMAVRPAYLHWLVRLPPETSPAALIAVFREKTSRSIFEEFPQLSKENPSEDFWAPGYLLVSGSYAIPAQLLRDFITRTRLFQGFQ